MITHCNICRQHFPPGASAFHCLDCAGWLLCSDCFGRCGEAHCGEDNHLFVHELVRSPRLYWRQLAWCRVIGNVYLHALRWFARRPLFGVQVRRQAAFPTAHAASEQISQESGAIDAFSIEAPSSYGAGSFGVSGGDGSEVVGIHWLTYQGALGIARSFGAALRERLPVGARVGLCAPNSPQWLCVDIGCALYGLPVVPFHAALTDAQIVVLVKQAALEGLVIDEAALPRFRGLLQDCPSLSCLIVIDEASGIEHIGAELATSLGEESVGVDASEEYAAVGAQSILRMSSLVRACLATPVLLDPALAGSLHTIAYTSGSTGQPKGVAFSGKAWRERFCHRISISPEVAVSYQPLSFASARSNVYLSLVNGGRVGFYDKRSDDDDGVGVFRAYQLFRPSVIISVPRLWNRLYTDYQAALALVRLQAHLGEEGVTTPVTEAAAEAARETQVSAGFRDILGGRTQLLLSGGAPVAPAVLAFLADCFQCRVVDGYGITECGGVTSEGRLNEGVLFRLEDLPALGYTRADQPYPRGELWVKTKGMADGYIGDVSDEAASRFVDGWFRTGDVVEQRGPREVHVIDRCAHVTKLAQGVFVSPERLEQTYQTSPFVSQVYLHCDPLRSDVLALVVPNVPALVASLLEVGAERHVGEGVEAQAKWLQAREKEVLRLVRHSLAEIAEEAAVRSFERPRGIALVWSPFSVENRCLTSTGKLARLVITQHYEALLSSLGAAEDARDTVSLRSQILALLAAQMPGAGVLDEVKDHESDANRSLGIDSLAAVTIRQQLLEKCQIDLPLAQLLQDPALDELLAMAMGRQAPVEVAGRGARATVDLMLEDAVWVSQVSGQPKTTRANAILLTGATGFLGPHLLLALAQAHPTRALLCLVRGTDEANASQRLQEACVQQGTWAALAPMRKRLQVCVGDLSQAHLGMSAAGFAAVAAEVGLVVHNGAQVNHALSYQALREANVEGTRWSLRLAAQGGAKVVFISSTSAVSPVVWAASGKDTVERLYPPTREHFSSLHDRDGYGQTKAVAEALVGAAHEAGVQGQLLRPGYIGGHSEYGAGNPGGTIARLWQACWAAGCVPKVAPGAGINIIPVDVVAAHIAARSTPWVDKDQAASGPCDVMHLYHPGGITPWSRLFAALEDVAQQEGRTLNQLSYKRWWRHIEEQIKASLVPTQEGTQPHPLLGLHHLWQNGLPDQSQRAWPSPTKLSQALAEELPALGEETLERWARWTIVGRGPSLTDNGVYVSG